MSEIPDAESLKNPAEPAAQPEIHEWIVTAARGDEQLLALMVEKEALGDELVALREAGANIEDIEGTIAKMRQVGARIIGREQELGFLSPDDR